MRFLCFLFLSLAAFAQEPVRYTLRFPAPHTHYLEVTASIPAAKPQIEVFMAVWTPGSYLVREYARNVEDFHARDLRGGELPWRKTRKNRWQIDAAGAPRVEVAYKVYAREMNVQGNWVDAGFAMLNGAPNFMTLAGAGKRPYEVRLELPPSWTKSISGLKDGPAPNSWLAADFDELLDSPIYAGNAPIHEFEVEGRKHYLVNEGEGPTWDGPASARDVARIVAEFSRQWGGLPYEKYVFFNILHESGGGLEHRNSVWMNSSHWAYGNTQETPVEAPGQRRPSRQGWLGLVSHEYFHAWNVKRLRPVELGPFDYENEVYTRGLWIAEGFTSYYGPLALRRAGLSTRDQFLRSLGQTISSLQSTPGRLVQSAETASFDAWIKLYRRDENSANTSISYYTKGAVVAFLLDARIRHLTGGDKTLDDLMLAAYRRYGGPRGYTGAEFRALASEIASADMSSWFVKVLETSEELDYSEALDWFGLRFRAASARPQTRLLTGLSTRTDNGRLIVTAVERSTPGERAGINVDDEILAVSGYRVRPEQWPSRLENYRPGDQVEVLVARHEKLITLPLVITQDKPAAWSLEVRPDATPDQKARLAAWLKE